jgi:hypothetical protein
MAGEERFRILPDTGHLGVTAGAFIVWISLILVSPNTCLAQIAASPPVNSGLDPAIILRTAKEAMGGDLLGTIRSITGVAECRGPKGPYETRIYSNVTGDMRFEQTFPDGRTYVGGVHEGRGWQQTDQAHYEWLDPAETAVLRGHEFPMLLARFDERFRGFRATRENSFEGFPANSIAMVDDGGRPAVAFFSPTTGLPLGLRVTNARMEGPQSILLRLDAWRTVNGLRLASHVTVVMGNDSWTFDFKVLKVNTADDSMFQIPKALKYRLPRGQ